MKKLSTGTKVAIGSGLALVGLFAYYKYDCSKNNDNNCNSPVDYYKNLFSKNDVAPQPQEKVNSYVASSQIKLHNDSQVVDTANSTKSNMTSNSNFAI